jgi:hypothetical protein
MHFLLFSLSEKAAMRIYWPLVALAGLLVFLLILTDLEREPRVDSLSDYRLKNQSNVDGTHPALHSPDAYLKRFTEESPFMRNERY